MTWEVLHWLALAVGSVAAFTYFRDLGDVTQAVFNVKRDNLLLAIQHESTFIATALLTLAVAVALHVWQQAGVPWVVATVVAINLLLVAFPWVWIHVGLRGQQDNARYFSISEARRWVRADDSVVVFDNNGHARAHPDEQLKRPHVAGTADGLGGEDVVMTFCTLTRLGLGYKPKIDGRRVLLDPVAQHGNNLIFRDAGTGVPIQQILGRQTSGSEPQAMQPWPTYRMTLRGFAKAFPDGQVYLNPIVPFLRNPLLCVFDNIVEMIFLWGTVPHHHSERLLFETLSVEDARLPRKTLVWGVTRGDAALALTEGYVRANGGVVNAELGGEAIVAAWHDDVESLCVYANPTGHAVSRVDFGGDSDVGALGRVSTLYAGVYWCVWANFFPGTLLNAAEVTP